MSDANQKKCWIYPCIGALIWIPIVSIIFIFQKNYIAAFAVSIFFALGVGYVLEYAPWKLPEMPVRKLYLGYVAIFIVSAVSVMYLWYPEDFCKVRNISSWIGFFPLFIPFFLLKNKNWNEMQSSEKKTNKNKLKKVKRHKKTKQTKKIQKISVTKTAAKVVKKTTKKTQRKPQKRARS
ncbi:MAG: hypothetical protein ABII18_01175 [bacterium]|nr:hypothetical protein [bacterium]MBU1917642.1 hypothetical protein [bacterium]